MDLFSSISNCLTFKMNSLHFKTFGSNSLFYDFEQLTVGLGLGRLLSFDPIPPFNLNIFKLKGFWGFGVTMAN